MDAPEDVAGLGRRLISSAQARVGLADGMDYVVRNVRPGRGFSHTEFAVREMGNGRMVWRKTFFPGPFDGLAGMSDEIREEFEVWVGWEKFDEELSEIPPIDLPAGATRLVNPDVSDDSDWFAVFDDQEAAEAFALTLAPVQQGVAVPPIRRSGRATDTASTGRG